jgi:D-alanine-D-alanine ligase
MGSAIAMDKVMSKRIFEQVGVPTARWRLGGGTADADALGYPLVVKPSREGSSVEGSSVGVSIVHRREELEAAVEAARRCHGEVLLEEYVKGRELNFAVLDDEVIGDVEVRPAVEFYTYEAKYGRNDTTYLSPAPITEEQRARLWPLALLAHKSLGCGGY